MKYFNNDQKRQQTKTNEQTKNKQIALVLAELENDIQNFKITIQKKDEQLLKFSKLIKATKTEYQKLHKENADLKKYIVKKNTINKNNKGINIINSNLKMKVMREKQRKKKMRIKTTRVLKMMKV